MTKGVLNSTRKKTTEEVSSFLAEKFPDIEFGSFDYKGQHTRIPFVCPKCNQARTRSYKDLSRTKNACNFCSGTGSNAKLTTEKFIAEMVGMYGEEVMRGIDTSLIEYVGANDFIKIRCFKHLDKPVNTVTPASLKTKKARTPCKWCNIATRIEGQYDTLESFITKIPESHEGKDSFENSEYISSKTKMRFTCLVDESHGDYFMRPNDYMNGRRCPKCTPRGTSEAEQELLRFCCTLPVDFVISDTSLRNRSRPDILLPKEGILIELHGEYWHSDGVIIDNKKSMIEKLKYASSIGLRLIQVMWSEWIHKPEIVKRRITHICGFGEIIGARATNVVKLSRDESSQFLDMFHIQGSLLSSKFYYGLCEKQSGELVAVATFGLPRVPSDVSRGYTELHRFATSKAVTGGLGKLLKAFLDDTNCTKLVTYADRRWGEGECYGKCGFTRIHDTDPGYVWSKSGKIVSRYAFQKHKLATLPEFRKVYSPDKTEDMMCRELGYYRVYDCGNVRWELIRD